MTNKKDRTENQFINRIAELLETPDLNDAFSPVEPENSPGEAVAIVINELENFNEMKTLFSLLMRNKVIKVNKRALHYLLDPEDDE